MDTSHLRLREGATAWLEIQDATVLLDLDASRYLGVNHAGSLLWSMLAAGTTRDELIDRLCATYSIDREQSAQDVDTFLDQCAQRGYLT
jgi:hypothetical protein